MLNSYVETRVIAREVSNESWLEAELQRRRRQNNNYIRSVWIWRILLIGGFLALWELAAAREWVNTFFISNPSAVAEFVLQCINSKKFWIDAWVTVQETLYGFAAAGIGGVLVAFFLAQSRLMRDVLDPILSFLNSLPRVAFAPLFVAFFGLGMLSKVVLAFSLCFFIVLNGTLTGLRNIDPDLEMLTRQLGASRQRHFTQLLVPSALPSIFSALRLSLIYGFLAVVVGEMLGSNNGLGQQIAFYSGMLRTDAVFGLLLMLGIIATVSVGLLQKIENYLLRWQ